MSLNANCAVATVWNVLVFMKRSGMCFRFQFYQGLATIQKVGISYISSSFSASVRKFSTRCTWLMAYLFSVASWHIFWCVYKHWFITGKNGHLASCQIDHYCLHLKIESSYVASSLFHIISLFLSLSGQILGTDRGLQLLLFKRCSQSVPLVLLKLSDRWSNIKTMYTWSGTSLIFCLCVESEPV